MKLKFTNLSPLRYPGSKKKIVSYLQKVIAYRKLRVNVIVEPFVGGGNVFLNFLANNIVDKVIIADKDELLYNFWRTVFLKPNSLVKFISRVKIDLNNFYKYKRVVKNIRKHDELKLAKACLFLNRTSFSGILRDGTGPIGGKQQTSKYKIDCRFNRKVLIDKIKYISKFKNRVIVLPYDWNDTIVYAIRWSKKHKALDNLLFYFDPPFYGRSKNLYRYSFNDEEHKRFCDSILALDNNWLLSYDNVKEVRQLYAKVKKKNMNIQMPYSVNSHAVRVKKELIITRLRLPNKKTLEKMAY